MNKAETWTGERLETFIFNDNTIEHLHRYAIATDIVKNKVVLDIASGEGYGSNLLAKYATRVYGVDIDAQAIRAAKYKYSVENIEFKLGTVDSIPLESNSVDVVISFETLEHHDKHNEMMSEIKRVLKIDGTLLISTPDKKQYSDQRDYKNPFHVKELYQEEFRKLINLHFPIVKYYSQNMFRGSLIVPEEIPTDFIAFRGDYHVLDSRKGFTPMYLLAVASNKEFTTKIPISGFSSHAVDTVQRLELQDQIRNDAKEEALNLIMKSLSFQIGQAILSPLRFFKRIWTKFP